MFSKLFNAPWPDVADLPQPIREQAADRIRGYWVTQVWPFVLGEWVLWLIVRAQAIRLADAYLIPALLMTIPYLMGSSRRLQGAWLTTLPLWFVIHGMALRGTGTLTALVLLLPYTFAAVMLAGGRRVFIQALCVIGFWFILFYEIPDLFPRLTAPRYLQVCYDILLAALTFQGVRYLNTLTLELNSKHVERVVTEQVTERSRHFLARVSHELRTPLNSILGFAKLLRRAPLSDTQTGYLQQIVDEGVQLDHLVNDLLDSAQLNAGKLILKREMCDINRICSVVGNEVRPLVKPGVRLITQLSDLPLIQVDPLRIQQIVRNLVSNAAKYTSEGLITIRTVAHENHLQIQVQDTGAGIPSDQQEAIFAPFVQRHERTGGIGLGLDIAHQLARLHGGEITVQSEVGVGSTFTVSLPIS
jgi:signal transduction histidine kinase